MSDYHTVYESLISYACFLFGILTRLLSFFVHPRDWQRCPEKKKELPIIEFMTEEHRQVITEKCSNHEEPAMPNLPVSRSLLATAGADDPKGPGLMAITPPPGHNRAVAENQNNIFIGAARKVKKKKGGVTPSPMPPKGAAAKGAAATAAAKKKPAAEKAKIMSKKSVAQHAKWQVDAVKVGGPNAKIVLHKPDAKKMIFDKLHDEFCPMNIDGV